MIQLNRSMMDRYEIPARRPETLRCIFFGADALMLGAVYRMIDRANELGRDLGAACVCSKAAADCLNAQDGMLTLMIRGEKQDGTALREERVLQGMLSALEPEGGFEALLQLAAEPELELIFCHAAPDALETGLIARLLVERSEKGLPMPRILCVSDRPEPGCADEIRANIAAVAKKWKADFAANLPVQAVLAETLCGAMTGAERDKRIYEMNYRDDMLAWAEPQLRLSFDGEVPALLQGVDGAVSADDFASLLARKARIFDSAVFLCAALGFLCGMDNFSQVMKDEQLRDWIGHAFFDEILPSLPYAREAIAPDVISAFERLENPMNDMRLLETGRSLLRDFPRTLLPAVRAYAEENFEAPRHIALALAAAIMLYAGARPDKNGDFCVQHGEVSQKLWDDPEILEDFARLAHDMPAETLAYAALANRAAWGADLREIDGLEMRVAFDLCAIQRIGLRQTIKLHAESKE